MTTATLSHPVQKPITVTKAALLEWLQDPIDASGPHDGGMRAEVLGDAERFLSWGLKAGQVILKTLHGRTILETMESNGSKLVIVDHVSSAHCRIRFWMNASSLKCLGVTLRNHPDLREPFDSIYLAR